MESSTLREGEQEVEGEQAGRDTALESGRESKRGTVGDVIDVEDGWIHFKVEERLQMKVHQKLQFFSI